MDNLNKSDKPPNEWFRCPGKGVAPYSNQDLEDRLLSWNDLEPDNFMSLIETRGKKIRKRAEQLFGLTEEEFDSLFAD